MASAVRIAIVNEEPIFRSGVEQVLMREREFLVVGTGRTASDALALAVAEEPDMILLDVDIACGLKAAADIRRKKPRVRILFLTCSECHKHVTEALRIGAAAYMLKGISSESLLRALYIVLAGGTYIMPQLATRLLMSASEKPKNAVEARNPLASLTAREQEILSEVSQGQTNKEIARKLAISESTVKYFMGRVLQKLGVRNRIEAVVLSRQATIRRNHLG